MVDLDPPRSEAPASSRGYKITRLLPNESGDRLYRIKAISEVTERVARESNLTLRSTP